MRANGPADMVAADDIMPDMIDTVFVQQIMISAGRAVNNGIIGTAGNHQQVGLHITEAELVCADQHPVPDTSRRYSRTDPDA